MSVKTEQIRSEKNGVSMAVTPKGLTKPIYLSPAQFEALVADLPALQAQYATIPQSERDAINTRAALPTDDRKAARIAAGLATAEKKLADAGNQLEKDIAEAELKLFKMKNGLS